MNLGGLGLRVPLCLVSVRRFAWQDLTCKLARWIKKYFIGLASPLAAILVTSSVMVARDHGATLTPQTLATICAVWTVICGLLMVSNVKYYSFKEFDRQKIPFVGLIIGVLIMGIVLYDIPVGVLAIGVIYALSGFWTTFMARREKA